MTNASNFERIASSTFLLIVVLGWFFGWRADGVFRGRSGDRSHDGAVFWGFGLILCMLLAKCAAARTDDGRDCVCISLEGFADQNACYRSLLSHGELLVVVVDGDNLSKLVEQIGSEAPRTLRAAGGVAGFAR